MKLFLLSFILFTSGISLKAQELPFLDKNFSCTSPDKIQMYNKDFRIDAASFGPMDPCESSADIKKLYNDLYLIENGAFESEKKGILIGGFVPSDRYYSWLRSQTRGVQRGNDIPGASAYNSSGYFTMQDGWANLSTLGRVGVFIHEGRHTAGYSHVPCRQGAYYRLQSRSCDTSFEDGGSHAVEMEYYARVAIAGKNFHPVYKTMARLMAMARANSLFNKPAISGQEALLARDKSTGNAILFAQDKAFERETADLPNAHLKRTSFGAVLFDGLNTAAIEMSERSGYTPLIPDTYSYFKLISLTMGAQSVPLLDFEEYDVGKRRYVVRLLDNGELSSFDFGKAVWSPASRLSFNVATTSTSLESGERGYFLISQQGEIFPYLSDQRKVGNQLSQTWNPEHQKIVAVNQKVYVLKHDGKIYEKTTDGFVMWPVAQGEYNDLISVPIYNAFEIKN